VKYNLVGASHRRNVGISERTNLKGVLLVLLQSEWIKRTKVPISIIVVLRPLINLINPSWSVLILVLSVVSFVTVILLSSTHLCFIAFLSLYIVLIDVLIYSAE